MTDIQEQRLRLAIKECGIRQRQAELTLASSMKHLAMQIDGARKKARHPRLVRTLVSEATILEDTAEDLIEGRPVDLDEFLSDLQKAREGDDA